MRTLLYLILALVISGCAYTGTHNMRLDEAQRLLSDRPREAFQQLNDMDVSEFEDSATVARWAMLYSESLLANNLHAPSDSIINIAADYYRTRDVSMSRRVDRLKSQLAATGEEDQLISALYRQKEQEFRLYKERVSHERYLFGGLLLLLAASAVIVWQRQRLMLQSARNDRLMAEASSMKCLAEARIRDVSDMQTVLGSMLSKRFALIDSLCQTYYESQGTKNERKAIAERVKAEIDGVRTDAFAEMERAVNECRGNLLSRLKVCRPDISREDYQLAVYMACGLSSRTISLLLGETVEVIYKRKSRLKARVRQSASGPEEGDLLAIF